MSMNMLFSILKNQFDFLIIISHLDVVRDMVDSLMEIQLDTIKAQVAKLHPPQQSVQVSPITAQEPPSFMN